MIRLIYRHYCDRCHVVIKVEEHGLVPRGPLPRPNAWKYAGMDLCETCAKAVGSVLREVMVMRP